MNRTAGKRAAGNNFRMAFRFAGGFGKLKHKLNESFRTLRIYVMKGYTNPLAVMGFLFSLVFQ
jgi:hypothetical protein